MSVKKAITVILVFVLCLGVMPFSAAALTSGALKYSITADYGLFGVEITGCDKNAEGDLIIPDTLGGLPVLGIADEAFVGCAKLKSITFPLAIDMLGPYMFKGCTSLEAVNVHKDSEYFASIDGVLFDKDYFSIYFIFEHMNGLPVIAEEYAGLGLLFCPVGKTGAYTVPDGVKYVEEGAFNGCAKLTQITIPASLLYIEDMAFAGCQSIMDYVVAEDNAYYSSSDGVLFDKKAEELLRFPQSRVGAVTVPAGTKILNGGSFNDCAAVTSVALPDSAIGVENNAFIGCTALTAFSVSGSNPLYSAVGGVLFNKDADEVVCCPVGYAGDYTVPAGVTIIGDGAFYGCTGLTGVTLPDGLKDIGTGAFSSCANLTEFAIPAGITEINPSAFSDCVKLQSVTIPEGVKTIWSGAFDGCTALSSVVYPDSVTQVGADTLNKTAYYQNALNWEADGLYNNKCMIAAPAALNASLTVKSGTVCIAANACYKSGVTALTVPDSVVNIGEDAFDGCEKLASVTLSNNLKTLGSGAFWGCMKLNSITLPDGITEIGYGALFDTAYSNDTANWKNGILYCGDYLVDTDMELSEHAEIKDGTVLLANYVFGDTYITGVTIPGSVRYIGTDAFDSCEDLTSVIMGEGIMSIGGWAFTNCGSLRFVRVPASVTQIGPYAFGFEYDFPDFPEFPDIPDSVNTAKTVKATKATKAAVFMDYDYEDMYKVVDGFNLGCYADSAAYGYALEYKVPYTLITPGSGLELIDKNNFLVDREDGQLISAANGLTVAELLGRLNAGNVVVADAAGKTLPMTGIVGTGCEIRLMDGETVKDKLTAVILGDTDGNGKVQIPDARQTLRAAAKLEPFTTAAQMRAADVTGSDGAVNVEDARLILRAAAGLTKIKLPQG